MFWNVFFLFFIVGTLAVRVDAETLSQSSEKLSNETRTLILEEIFKSDNDVIQLKRSGIGSSSFSVEKQRVLDSTSGPGAHDPGKAKWGESIGTSAVPVMPISLKNAALDALKYNLDGQMARLLPEIRDADKMEAESVFDWEAFTSMAYNHAVQIDQASSYHGVPMSPESIESTSLEGRMGIRKRISTGASIEASSGLVHRDTTSDVHAYFPNPAYQPETILSVKQPILRNAGPTVNRFKIVFAENTKEIDTLKSQDTLSQVAFQTEKAYWELSSALYSQMIAQELLSRTKETIKNLEARKGLDVKPVQMAQAKSYLLSRSDELMRTQAEVRNAGDRLKEIINSTEYKLLDESVILPEDRPVLDVEESITLYSAVDKALTWNKELRQALIEYENINKELEVDQIQLSPQLDLGLEGKHNGIGDRIDNSYKETGDRLGWKVLLELSVPLGNQAAQSAYNRTKLKCQDRRLNYMKVARSVTRSIKESLRKVQLTYRLTVVSREARLAAAENLRILEEREKDAEPMSPEFLLDMKLSAQQRLSEAEINEYKALVDSRIAYSAFLHVSGILLERFGVSNSVKDGFMLGEDS